MVVWSDEKFGTYFATAARISPSGAVLDTGICVSTGVGSYEYNPKIAFDGNRCLAIWPKSGLIQGRFITSSGLPEDTVFNIASGASGPAIACDGNNYLVAWFVGTYPNLDIKARLVSPTGTLIGPEITITTDADCNRWPDVIFDGYQYVVVWTKGANSPSSQYVWAQGIASDGSLISGNFLISNNTAGQRWFPAIAASDSNYLVTWGQAGPTSDIYGNIDQGMLGIEEGKSYRSVEIEPVTATFTCRSLSEFFDAGYQVYDILGCEVTRGSDRPGIYFVKNSLLGEQIKKVIKVK